MELFRKAIEGNEAQLVKQIETDGGLWIHLLSRRVLTDDLMAECQAEVNLFHLIIIGLLKILVIVMSVNSSFIDIYHHTDQAI